MEDDVQMSCTKTSLEEKKSVYGWRKTASFSYSEVLWLKTMRKVNIEMVVVFATYTLHIFYKLVKLNLKH